MGRTPSGWYADAAGRDAGHDQMQVELFAQLNGRPETYSLTLNGVRYQQYDVIIEYPFMRDGRILGFADVCEMWEPISVKPSAVPPRWFLTIYEVKPRIHSVGALVRQARATVALARQVVIGRTVPVCDLFAVVPHDDPKLAQLQQAFPWRVVPWKDGQPIPGLKWNDKPILGLEYGGPPPD